MNEIKSIILKAIKKEFPKLEIPDFNVEPAPEKFGDFSTTIAMILAKRVGESPEEIAQKIIEKNA